MPSRLKKFALKLSKGLKYTLWGINIVFIILILLATQAPQIPPSDFKFISFLGIGFPFLFAFNLFFLALWIISLRWKFIVLQILILFFCINTIKLYIPFNNRNDIKIPETAFKVMTYNVRGFDWLIGEEARNNPILEYLANSNADIICLQEFAVAEKKATDGLISLDEFDDIMDKYPYRSIIRLGDNTCLYGLACYSKYPIIKVARVPIDSKFNGSAMYEIEVKSKRLTVVNNHLESNHITAEDKELYQQLVVEPNRERLGVVADNVQGKLDFAFKTREKQVNIIYDCIEQQLQKTERMLVCGDFNDTPVSYAYGKFKKHFTDSYLETGRGVGITYHENMFWFRIDYILHTSNIDSYMCTVDKVKYSDHYPVYTYIRL